MRWAMDLVAMRCWAWKEGMRASTSKSLRMASTLLEANWALKESLPIGAPRTRVPSWENFMSAGKPSLRRASLVRFGEGAYTKLLSLRSSPWRSLL